MNTPRIALVTGAAQGIGKSIASRLCEEGYKVVLADINAQLVNSVTAELLAHGYKVFGIVCDVSSVDSIKNTIKATVDTFGGLDVLVNNAGILRTSDIPNLDEAEWDQVLAVNLKSVFFMVQQALPYLKKSLAPRIINMSSLAGRMGGFNTSLSYSASKGGVLALTMGLARQLAPFNITVNAVCPSTTESDMILQWDEETRALQSSRAPLGRLGKPDEIASAVNYLASTEAAFVTGLLMDVNGGTYMG